MIQTIDTKPKLTSYIYLKALNKLTKSQIVNYHQEWKLTYSQLDAIIEATNRFSCDSNYTTIKDLLSIVNVLLTNESKIEIDSITPLIQSLGFWN
jgi:hypothetical protein